MPRVALYARYSDDKQSPASINDQFLICRVRISQKSDSCFVKSRTSASVNPGQLV